MKTSESKEYWRIANAMFSNRREGEWRRYVRHVMPELVGAGELAEMPDDRLPRRICSRARTGILKLSSAHTTLITPRGVNWFSYEAGREATDKEKEWYKEAAQVTQKELETSNFYPASIAMTIDRCATGTGLMLAEADRRRNMLVFTHVPAGTYALAENDEHEIDMVVRKFKFSAAQCLEAFGEEGLTAGMAAALRDKDRRHKENEFEIWHLTMPREVPRRGNTKEDRERQEMPYASVYVSAAEQTILKEGGYEEFPYMATRFMKYGNQVFGESALAGISDTIEDMIVTEEALKTIGQAAAYPRVLSSAELGDELDLRAGGVTIVPDKTLQRGLPREWAASGRFDVGLNLLEMYRQEIDDALFVAMLQTVTQVERQMTATEAQIRENEKLMTFGQSFTQFTADFRVLMNRVFCLLVRMGKLDVEKMPEGVLEATGPNGDEVRVLSPGISYIGRLAKALESQKQQGLLEALSQGVQMMQATQNPEWMDYFKPYECVRFVTDETNVPVECLRSADEMEELRQKREAAQEAQETAALAEREAAALADNARGAAALGGR